MNIFNEKLKKKVVRVNLYADEIQDKECPVSGEKWHYIGLVIERLDKPLLGDILDLRFCGNFDEESSYFPKNNQVIHWCELTDANARNVCARWFDYLMKPGGGKFGYLEESIKSGDKLYFSMLGINASRLNLNEFDKDNEFNSVYNRFFRTAVKSALKNYFPDSLIVIENIYHEEGQQGTHKYFPWHCLKELESDSRITCNAKEIEFLPKDHKLDERSNIIQLCDCIMGCFTSIIHGFEESSSSEERKFLCQKMHPLVSRLVPFSYRPTSRYGYLGRISISFFPQEKTDVTDLKRFKNQFYTDRQLHFIERNDNQLNLFE